MKYEDIKAIQADMHENDQKGITMTREFFDSIVSLIDDYEMVTDDYATALAASTNREVQLNKKIERLNHFVIKEKDRKRIISEIWERIKKYSFYDVRLKEGGGLEKVSMVFRNDVNKCLRDFLIEWVGDIE